MVAWFTVASLFITYIFSFIDRMIIGLLVEPMKADLEISDTQISLLQGLAFAVFYTIAGIPIARFIDRATRVRIVSAGIAVWSLMTMVCGLSQQYWQLFLARIGVGIGEATLSPAAYSIISDSFSPRRLGVAMGVYVLGSSVGAGLAFLIGAVVIALISSTGEVVVPLLGPVRAWQAAFLYVGAPGLLISLLFVFIPEPARRLTGKSAHVAATTLEVWRFSRANARSLLGICIGVGLVNMAAFAAISWLPVLYMRAHGFELAEAGYMAGAALIVGGMIGLLGGGWICDRLGGTPRNRVRVSAWAVAIGIAAGVAFPLVSSATLSAALFVLFFSACSVPAGSAVSAIQQIVPNDMRATVSAVYLFFVSIIGMTLGPTAIAMIGDVYFPGGDGIRYAVSIVAGLGMAVATGLLLLAGSVLKRPVNDPRSRLPGAGSPA